MMTKRKGKRDKPVWCEKPKAKIHQLNGWATKHTKQFDQFNMNCNYDQLERSKNKYKLKFTDTMSSVRSLPFPKRVGNLEVENPLKLASVAFVLFRNKVTSFCKLTVFKCCFNLLVGMSWFEMFLSSPRNDEPTWLTKDDFEERSLTRCSKCLVAFWR